MHVFRAFLAIAVFLTSAPLAAAREWTDASGTMKFEAVFVAVKNGKVYLEKPNGDVVTLPLERLSKTDFEFLKARGELKDASAGSPKPTGEKPPALDAAGAALAERAQAVLKANCYRCHGQAGANEGGFNFALNLPKLAQRYVVPGNLAGSLLWQRVSTKDSDVAMPPAGEDPRPSAEDLAALRQWIEAGAKSPASSEDREFISNEQVIAYVLSDVCGEAERNRRFLRYFSLTNLYNAGISEDELQTYRLAFAKLVNSLSWNNALVVPVPIDKARTILRVDIRKLNWSDQTWSEIVKAYPYGLQFPTDDFKSLRQACQTEMPCVRIDWFVFAASRPPLYHTVLGIPKTDKELETLLRVDAASNISQEKVARAGFNRSGVSQNNRLIERHVLSYGSYWKSYDFGGNIDRQNLFEHPLGPGTNSASFKHDGGELIFTLPNGLQGYMLVDASGNRIDKGPTEIVSDPRQADRTVWNGVSCISCHYAGMIPKSDEVRPFVAANRKSFADPEAVLALYPEQSVLDQHYQEDGKRFSEALAKIGLSKLSKKGEPVSSMAQRFEQELDLRVTAAEFGLPPVEFSGRLEKAQSVVKVLGTLKVSGGTVKRDVFVSIFAKAAFELGIIHNATGLGSVPLAKIDLQGKDDSFVGEIRRTGNLGWGVTSLAFSPDGGKIAAGKMDRAVLLFDVNTMKQLDGIEKLENLGQVTRVAFTPDGKKLLAGGYSGRILIWEVTPEGRLKPAGQFVGHSGEILALAMSFDGKTAFSGGRDKLARYWELETGKELRAFDFKDAVKATYIFPDGRKALASDGATLQIINLDAETVRVLSFGSHASQGMAISPDGSRIASCDGYELRLWNTETGAESPRFKDNEMQWVAAFSPDGKHLLSGGRAKFNVWDIETRKRIHAQDTNGSAVYVQTLACSPDNRHVGTIPGSAGQALQIYRLPAEQ